MRVLAIEDDESTAEILKIALAAAGIECDIVRYGEKGLETSKLQPTYDLLILDLLLPDTHGYEVLQKLRGARVRIPVLILSGISEVEQKIKGLGFGADDYMTKPFHGTELIARIRAIVRRSKGHAQSIATIDKICINLDTRTVEVDNQPIHLTSKEYAILELLFMRRGTILTKEMFLDHIYRNGNKRESKIVDVFICKLRKKLYEASGGRNYIETMWSKGYMLREHSSTEDVEDSVPSNLIAESVY